MLYMYMSSEYSMTFIIMLNYYFNVPPQNNNNNNNNNNMLNAILYNNIYTQTYNINLVRIDVAFALTSCKLRWPLMSLMVTDLGLLLRVAILEAIVENSCVASIPHAP